MKKNVHDKNLGMGEDDLFENINNSLLEMGLSQEEIDMLVKEIILKKEGLISEEMALMILLGEFSNSIKQDNKENEEEEEEVLPAESDYRALELEDWIEIGNGFYEEGLYLEAIKYYERALDEDQELTQIWKKLGNCNLKIGDYDDANICFIIARQPVVDLREIFLQIQLEDELRAEEEEELLRKGVLQDGEYIQDEDEKEIPFKEVSERLWQTRAEKAQLKDIYKEMELPIVEMPKDSWSFLVEGSNDSLWDFPVTLSCNPRKDVWFCEKYGRHRVSERRYIDLDVFPSVENVVNLVLEFNPRGARFHLTREGAYLTRKYKYRKLCVIVVE